MDKVIKELKELNGNIEDIQIELKALNKANSNLENLGIFYAVDYDLIVIRHNKIKELKNKSLKLINNYIAGINSKDKEYFLHSLKCLNIPFKG